MLHHLRGLGPADKNAVEGRWKAYRWQHPRAPTVRTLFQKDKAMQVVLRPGGDSVGACRNHSGTGVGGGGRRVEDRVELRAFHENVPLNSVCCPRCPPFISSFGAYTEQESGKPQSDGRHRMVLRVGIGNGRVEL